MEKYTRYADPTTGVNPFVPSWVMHPRRHIVLEILTSITLLPVVLIRSVFGILGILFITLNHILCFPFIVFPSLHRRFLLTLTAPFLKLIMTCLGIKIEMVCAESRRLKLFPNKGAFDIKHIYPEQLNHGDIILSNYTGFYEILLLTYLYRPVFARPIFHNSKLTMDIVTPYQKIKDSFKHSMISQSKRQGQFNSLKSMSDYCYIHKKGPVVVFPENQKSNGKALLTWKCPESNNSDGDESTFQNFNETLASRCILVTVQYYHDQASYTPPHTAYSGLYHIFRLLFEPANLVTFTWTTKPQMKEVVQRYLDKKTTNSTTASCQHTLDFLRETMKQLLPTVQLVALDGSRLEEFANYFAATQKAKYKSA